MFGQRSKVGVCPINSHVLCRAGQVGFRTLVAGCIDVGVGRKKTLHHVRVALLRREMKRPRETSTVAAGGGGQNEWLHGVASNKTDLY